MDHDGTVSTSNNGPASVNRCQARIMSAARIGKGCRWNVRNILVATVFLSLFIALLNPNPHSQQVAEGAKLKKEAKKLLKSLVKGFVVNKLTTRKNFMPLPVPIPVPIELSEPPGDDRQSANSSAVYLKGKPKYVNVYKATTPVVKPTTVYHMPVYSPTYQGYSTSMVDSTQGLYGPAAAMMSGHGKAYGSQGSAESQSMMKHSFASDSAAIDSAMNSANFNDFDDDASNYYIRKSSYGSGKRKRGLVMAPALAYGDDEYGRRSDTPLKSSSARDDTKSETGGSPVRIISEKKESVDEADSNHIRVKRQIYMSSSSDEGVPCYGFPLEINVKSRLKMDSLFPIHGKSQFKKCIKVGRPQH